MGQEGVGAIGGDPQECRVGFMTEVYTIKSECWSQLGLVRVEGK